ncbi:MAG: helix-turn-helix domain-containing protein, partial [Streptomyces sp.]|nr:helix-turn-helix domain-containing protein [Streptomyces sp.]
MPTDDRSDDLTLGAALRRAREAAGLSVEDVSADTRIRATLVRDLEADRFTSSGGA